MKNKKMVLGCVFYLVSSVVGVGASLCWIGFSAGFLSTLFETDFYLGFAVMVLMAIVTVLCTFGYLGLLSWVIARKLKW